MSGTLTLVPDVFAGDDGIFLNTGQWAPGQLVGIRLDSTSTPPARLAVTSQIPAAAATSAMAVTEQTSRRSATSFEGTERS